MKKNNNKEIKKEEMVEENPLRSAMPVIIGMAIYAMGSGFLLRYLKIV